MGGTGNRRPAPAERDGPKRLERWVAFDLALDGREGGAAPDEWLLSRICEEFNCTPAEAVEQPLGLVLDILELRAYARAKDQLDRAKSEADVPRTAAVERVFEVQAERWKRKKAERGLG